MINVSKQKLPKGLSYPLKTSDIESALQYAGFEIDCIVTYTLSPGRLRVHFWPPNENFQFERLYMVVGPVKSQEARSERDHTVDQVLPKLISWLNAILKLPPNSPLRREEQVFLGPELQKSKA